MHFPSFKNEKEKPINTLNGKIKNLERETSMGKCL